MVKFFHGRRLQCHIGMSAPQRTQDGGRKLVILFRVALNGDVIRSAPQEVKDAYDSVKTKGQSESKPKREVENINADFFNGPDTKNKSLRMKSLYLEALDVKEVKNAAGDMAIALTFKSSYEFDEKVWDWLGNNYKTDVFVEFDAAQATLLDIEEKDEKGENEDQAELETGEEESDEEEEEEEGEEEEVGVEG